MTNRRPPKHRLIYQELYKAIHAGDFSEGARLPSEAELAKRFQASRPTVGRALRDLEEQGMLSRRAGSGTYVRLTESVKGRVFGLIIPHLGDTEIFEPICRGMAQSHEHDRIALLWGNTVRGEDRAAQARRLCDHYIAQRVSGVFFAPLELTPAKDQVNEEVVHALDRAGIAVVLLDRCIYAYPRRSAYDLVGIDNRRAGYVITEHLLKLGSRRVMFLSRPNSASTVDARIAGYREALYAFGLPIDAQLIQRGDPADQNFVRALSARLAPEAIVCANDDTAAHLMHSLDELGMRAPRDVRIAGIDDVKYASLLRVPLTTVRQPCHDIGVAAMAAMLERMEHPAMPPRDILLDFTLVVRESCGGKTRVNGAETTAGTVAETVVGVP